MATDPNWPPEPIPPHFGPVLVGTTAAQLDALGLSVSGQLASGVNVPDVVESLVRVGWDRSFSQWYVQVYANGGSVASVIPTTVAYPRESFDQPGNWWDKQVAPYTKGSISLWFFVFCCQCVGFFLALLALAFCKTETGKDNAKRLMLYSGIGMAVAFVLRLIVTLIEFSNGGASR